MTVGLTSDKFVGKFKRQSASRRAKGKIKSFAQRKQALLAWLRERGYLERATVIAIDDPYEPAASRQFDALVVTRENKTRGEEINQMRARRGLPQLKLLEVAMVKAVDGGPISSTRVRNGEIDRVGRLVMPEILRPQLQLPLDTVLTGSDIARSVASHKQAMVITVGDVATKTLLDMQILPFLSIIDGKVGRKPFTDSLDQLRALQKHQPQKVGPFKAKVTSGPGYISKEAVAEIKRALQKPENTAAVIVISGEEDLLALPAIIHAPVGSVVYYGQPGEGLVEVLVTEEKKKEAKGLLEQFTS